MPDDNKTAAGTGNGNDDAAIVKRVLKENKMAAERALAVLVGTIVGRHVDCELRKMGRKPPWTPGNERLNALTASLDALHQARHTNKDDVKLAEAQRVLFQLFFECQVAAEKRAGILDDEDDGNDEPPRMRLVRD